MSNSPYSRLITIVLFSIVLIVATFFRVYNLESAPPGLYPDEAMNGNNALEAIATNEYKLFYPENNGREGLFINIQAQALKLFGVTEPWVLRSVSAVFGILTVLGVFLLILQLYRIAQKDARAGLLAAFSGSFLMAVSFWHVNFSRIGFRAIMAPFFIVWSMYILLRAFQEDQLSTFNFQLSTRRKLWQAFLVLLAGVFFGLGMHSYIAYRALPIFVLFVFALYYLSFLRKQEPIRAPLKKILARLGIFVVGSLLSTVSLINFFIQNPQDFFGRTSQISIFNSDSPAIAFLVNIGKTFLSFFWFGDYNWRHNYAGMGELYPLVAVLFLVGIIIGIRSIVQYLRRLSYTEYRIPNTDKDERSTVYGLRSTGDVFIFLFASSLFVVALLPTIISSEGIPHALRAIIMIPATFILVGMGAEYLFTRFNLGIRKGSTSVWGGRTLLGFFIFVFFLLPALHTYHLYFNDWASRTETKDGFSQDYVDVGREMLEVGSETTKYVIVNESSVDVRGIPVRAITTMFITDTFTPEKQKEKNVFYVLSKDADSIPEGAEVFYVK